LELKELTDFWTSDNADTGIKFVNFTDGIPIILEIKSWKVYTWEYQSKNWPDAYLLRVVDGRYLKINNQTLRKELMEHKGKYIKVELTRYDSKPNSLDTWYQMKLLKTDSEKQTVKGKSK